MARTSRKAKPDRQNRGDRFRLRDLADIREFETEKTFEERCSARSIYDVFAQSAERYPDHIALTMIMTGEADEIPRDVSYRDLLEGITRAANFFHDLAGPKPGVGLMLPKYAGELPVCYVRLKPGASVTAEELHGFGQPRIAERPAWPKRIYIVDTIPMTGVGKIFKPQLREDAARRLIIQAVAETIGSMDARIVVALGGRRGMNVDVVLPDACAVKQSEVENVLEGYNFDCTVSSALKA